MLISLREYREKYFSDDSRPSRQTIWNWAKQRLLPVQRKGKFYYVDTDKLKEPVSNHALTARILARK